MTCGPNYDISLKRSLWRCCGNFCSSMQWECCSIWPESKLWSGCTFDKINSRADLLHSAMISHFCCAPTKAIAIWCDIKRESTGSATGSSFLFVLVKSYEREGITTCTSKHILKVMKSDGTIYSSYCWQQMALLPYQRVLPPPVCWVIICVCIGHERFILQ